MTLLIETPEEARTLAALLRERRVQLQRVCARAAEADGIGWPDGEAELARVVALQDRVDAAGGIGEEQSGAATGMDLATLVRRRHLGSV